MKHQSWAGARRPNGKKSKDSHQRADELGEAAQDGCFGLRGVNEPIFRYSCPASELPNAYLRILPAAYQCLRECHPKRRAYVPRLDGY